MRQETTHLERQQFEAEGFVVLPDVLNDSELRLWRDEVGRAVEDRSSLKLPYFDPTPDDAAETYYDRVFTQRVNLWQTHPEVRALVHDPRLGKLASELADAPAVRFWADQALVKEPYAHPTAFHLDLPYWPFTVPNALSIWIALDDATLTNGCLYYVPGSHRPGRTESVMIGPHIGALFDVYPEWADRRPVPVPIPAGSAVCHNALTAHGAGANMTPDVRRAMVCIYMPDGATYNGRPGILPPHVLENLEVGDVLDDERQNPLIYRRPA